MIPVNAPTSAAMFVIVARSSTESDCDRVARVLDDLADRVSRP